MATNAKNLAELLNTDTTVAATDVADNSISASKLDIVGNGTSGQFLKTDGDGSFSYINAPVDKGKNILINGSFNHWQRGTSFSSDVYGADRWKFYAPGSHAYSRSTDTPDSPNNFKYSASLGGSGDATGLTQFVESVNAVHIPSSGSTKVILSFYLKHSTNSGTAKITSVVGTMNSEDDSSASTNRSTQNHNTTTSWARYTHEMTGADLTAAVTNGLVVTIKHNGAGATAFLLTGCQLEINESATDFERRSYGEELILCQRYYSIKQNTSGASRYFGILQAYGNGDLYGCLAEYPVQMRALPQVTQSGTWGAYTAASGDGSMANTIGSLLGTSYGWNTTAWGGGSGFVAGHASIVYAINNAKLMADAEL